MALYQPHTQNKFAAQLLNQLASRSLFISAVLVGAYYHSTVKRISDNILYNGIPLEEDHFSDPRGWTVELEITESGKRAYYLHYGKMYVPLTNSLVHKLKEFSYESIRTE